jgi:GH24 family phage-related lysozyme (muramidase)
MADISKSISIATAFIQKEEKLASGSASSTTLIGSSAPDNTPVYAYWDSVGGKWTIGWGNTYYQNKAPVNAGDKITKAQARDLNLFVVRQKEAVIRNFVPYTRLTDNQYAVLISIAYNAGEGNLHASRIMDAVNSGASPSDTAAVIKSSLVTSQGVYVQGLANRRVKEAALWLSNDPIASIINAAKDNPKTTGVVVSAILFMVAYSVWAIHHHTKSP